VNDSVAALVTGLDRHGLARKALKVEAAADAGHETDLDAYTLQLISVDK
jgi:hypothetical protein